MTQSSHTVASPPTPLPHILVVEDDVANRLALKIFLERQGYSTRTAENGVEAVKKALSEHFDIIIMDIQLPGLDGIEATRRIREGRHKAEMQLPVVIALTAHAMRDDREKILSCGLDDYISKPVDLYDLLKVIQKHTPDASS